MNNERIKNLKFKMLLFLILGLVGLFLSKYLSGLHQDIIILQNEELFSKEIEPIDYYAHEVEDGNVDAGYIYSEEDQPIIDKREDLLSPAQYTKVFGAIGSFVLLIFSLFYYDKYSKEKKKSHSV
jgi:hypothetical protein